MLRSRVSLEAQVQEEDVQHIQKLALVLVDALDLAVEQGMLVHHNTREGMDRSCQGVLVLLLDCAPLAPELRHPPPAARGGPAAPGQ